MSVFAKDCATEGFVTLVMVIVTTDPAAIMHEVPTAITSVFVVTVLVGPAQPVMPAVLVNATTGDA